MTMLHAGQAVVTKLWTAVGIRPLAHDTAAGGTTQAPGGVGKVEALAQQDERPASATFIVMRAGDPIGGHDASVNRAVAHAPPIKALISASCRRNVAQLRKFPSQSVTAQGELIAAFVVVTTNRVLPAVAS